MTPDLPRAVAENIEHFTGRTWLLPVLLRWLKQPDGRLFLLTGRPGTGKSTLTSWLAGAGPAPADQSAASQLEQVRDQVAAAHYCIAASGNAAPKAFAENMANQLTRNVPGFSAALAASLSDRVQILGWNEIGQAQAGVSATGVAIAHLDLGSPDDELSFDRILRDPLKKLYQDGFNEPLLLLVDALDEAAVYTGKITVPQLLAKLVDLPPQIRVIATTRADPPILYLFPDASRFDLVGNAPKDEDDVFAYASERLAGMLNGEARGTLARRIADASEGVFLYAHLVLRDLLARPPVTPDLALTPLPKGLSGLYTESLNRYFGGNRRRWHGSGKPLLGLIAVAQGNGLSRTQLEQISGLDVAEPLEVVGQYLDGDLPDGPFRPFHRSFTEFLIDEANGAYRIDAARSHCQIADRYLTAWGGLDAGLPALAEEPSLAQRDGGYPLRWLSTHLLATSRADDLHRLLSCERHDRNLWYAVHEHSGDIAGFLADVEQARRATEQQAGGASGQRHGREDLGRQVRYHLIEASVASASTRITSGLLAVLVKRKPQTWTPVRALGTVERMTDEEQQARALQLLGCAGRIPPSLAARAWSIAVRCREQEARSRALAAVIPQLPDELLDGAIQVVAGLTGQAGVPRAAAALVRRLPQDRLTGIPWQAMPKMAYQQKMGIHALVALKQSGPSAAQTALACIEEINNKFERCLFLAALIPSLPETAFDRALSMLAACPANYRGDPLVALARHAPSSHITRLIEFARDDVAWQSPPPGAEPRPWSRMMEELGPRLSRGAQPEDQEAGALRLVQSLLVERSAEAIEVLARHLTAESARQALRQIDAESARWAHNGDGRWEMIAVTALARRLPPSEAGAVVERCVRRRCRVDDDLRIVLGPDEEELTSLAAETLAPAASSLPRDTVRQALRAICRGMSLTTDFAADLSPALARLAPVVCQDPALVREALDLTLTPGVWHPGSRLTVLSVLAPHLATDDRLDDDRLSQAMDRAVPGPVEVECFAAIAALGRELSSQQRRAEVARQAWDTAKGIGNTRHRIHAVAALAPVLPEYLAREALELVGSVNRTDVTFPTVLSALDALATRLPARLLPTALAVFMDTPMIDSGDITRVPRLFERLGRDDPTGALRHHVVGPESQRFRPWDSWLSALAPFLSADLAREALPVARALPAPEPRRYALAALAPQLPQELQAAVTREVLELLDVPPDDFTVRASVLAQLAAATTTDEVTAACDSLLTAIRFADIIAGESWSAVLELLGHLPRDVGGRVLSDAIACLEAAEPATDAEERNYDLALVALAKHMPDRHGHERRRVLTSVLNRAVTRHWWAVFGPVFVELIPLLPPPQRREAIESALRQAIGPSLRADDLDALTPLFAVLDGPELETAFHELTKVQDPHVRADAMAAVLRRAGELADPQAAFATTAVCSLWPPGITRAELFDLVAASAWWLRQHGSEQAVAAAIDAAFDVSRWWR